MIPHRFKKDELESLKSEIIQELQQIILEHMQPSRKRWLRSHEVLEMLGISTNTLIKLRDNHALPYTKFGRLYFYDRVKIDLMLAERTRAKKIRQEKFKIF